jgi:hypothetical protein
MSDHTLKEQFWSALLLDALVIPGAGHWFAGFQRQAAAMIAAVLLLLFVPLFRFVAAVFSALHQSVLATGMPLRSLEALKMAWLSQRTSILACAAGIVLIWIYGIVDLSLRRRQAR